MILDSEKSRKAQEIILSCANDDECLIIYVIRELAETFNICEKEAMSVLLESSDYVISDERIAIERSDILYGDSILVDKQQFFEKLPSLDLSFEADCFYYISYIPARPDLQEQL